MIGVSPAYFFSLHGSGFDSTHIIEELPSLSQTGYTGFQAEIFDAGAGSAWTKQAVRNLNEASRAASMTCTAFVAHFLGSSFTSPGAIGSFILDETVRRVIEAAAGIEENEVFALPLPAFFGDADTFATRPAGSLLDALGTLAEAVQSSGLQFALELMPGNVLGGSLAFLQLIREPGFGDSRLVFDTGHFWAMGEDVGTLPMLLAGRIAATHLCDNDGVTNLSLCPGDGTVPFNRLVEGLAASAYPGSLDAEIVCPAANVQAEYTRAAAQLRLVENRIARTQADPISTIRSTP